ncbi:hypothetical protein [Duganella hordei]|uniref:hypothetical protein n=1 Tax=Duganella hordei TaxID=2865934 RepID=UPI003341B707
MAVRTEGFNYANAQSHNLASLLGILVSLTTAFIPVGTIALERQYRSNASTVLF